MENIFNMQMFSGPFYGGGGKILVFRRIGPRPAALFFLQLFQKFRGLFGRDFAQVSVLVVFVAEEVVELHVRLGLVGGVEEVHPDAAAVGAFLDLKSRGLVFQEIDERLLASSAEVDGTLVIDGLVVTYPVAYPVEEQKEDAEGADAHGASRIDEIQTYTYYYKAQ